MSFENFEGNRLSEAEALAEAEAMKEQILADTPASEYEKASKKVEGNKAMAKLEQDLSKDSLVEGFHNEEEDWNRHLSDKEFRENFPQASLQDFWRRFDTKEDYDEVIGTDAKRKQSERGRDNFIDWLWGDNVTERLKNRVTGGFRSYDEIVDFITAHDGAANNKIQARIWLSQIFHDYKFFRKLEEIVDDNGRKGWRIHTFSKSDR